MLADLAGRRPAASNLCEQSVAYHNLAVPVLRAKVSQIAFDSELYEAGNVVDIQLAH